MPDKIPQDSVGLVVPETIKFDEPLELACGRTLINYQLVIETYGKLNEEKNNAINELKGRIDGVGTKIQYLLERLNIYVVESRMSAVNNNFDSYELKIYKLVRKIYILEQNLNQYFQSFQNK